MSAIFEHRYDQAVDSVTEKPRVLFVDDEEFILTAFKRALRDRYELVTTSGPYEALEALRTLPPFAVVVSDMRMPEMDGATLLGRIHDRWPDTARILLTGQADTDSAIEAINKGAVFKYLCKPWEHAELVGAIDAGVAQQRLVLAERALLETTVTASVRTMAELLAIAAPLAHRRAAFAQACVVHAMGELAWADAWIYEVSAALSQIGCVGVPTETLQAYMGRGSLSAEDRAYMAEHPERGYRLLASIPRLEAVADIVRYQASAPPADAAPAVIRGVELLRAALALEREMSAGNTARGNRLILRDVDPPLDPTIMDALADFRGSYSELRAATVDELKPGWIVDEEIRTADDTLVMAKGHELSETAILTLRRFHACHAIEEPIYVRCTPETPQR